VPQSLPQHFNISTPWKPSGSLDVLSNLKDISNQLLIHLANARVPPPVPHIALQPVIAENSLISDFQSPEAPLEISEFNKLAIDYHDVQIFIPEDTQNPFQLFSLFFTP
jgi:hypothetical protein